MLCERATIEVILDVDGAIRRAMMSMLFSTTVRDFGESKKKINAKKEIKVTDFNVAAKIF